MMVCQIPTIQNTKNQSPKILQSSYPGNLVEKLAPLTRFKCHIYQKHMEQTQSKTDNLFKHRNVTFELEIPT